MKKIQTRTCVSRYEITGSVNKNDIINMIKQKMAMDISREILNKVEFEQSLDEQTGDTIFRLGFYLTTNTREAKIVGAFVETMEELMKKAPIGGTA